MQDMMLYQLLSGRFSSGGFSLDVILLAGLLITLLWKPERIHSVTLFRWACTFVALSAFLPSLASGLSYLYFGQVASFRRPLEVPVSIHMIASGVGPFLVGMAILCALAALTPPIKGTSKPPRPDVPVRHPLD